MPHEKPALPVSCYYHMEIPPSIKMVSPVMKSEAFEAKKITAPPNSSGAPNLLSGVLERKNFLVFGFH